MDKLVKVFGLVKLVLDVVLRILGGQGSEKEKKNSNEEK